MNVALMAGLALLPCVVLVGLLNDAGATLPTDIGVASLRGALDDEHALASPGTDQRRP